jgi:formylglycine-generating enzyme required for sulfatase activity
MGRGGAFRKIPPANLRQGDFPHDPKALDGYLLSAPVDSDKPNAYGLHHIIGNVREWCADCYRTDTYKNRPQAERQASIQKATLIASIPTNPVCRSA